MKLLRRLAGAAVALLVCAPFAFLLTVLLSPLWSWVETTYKIESIGHSGPSDWCFYLVYVLVVIPAMLVFRLIVKRPD